MASKLAYKATVDYGINAMSQDEQQNELLHATYQTLFSHKFASPIEQQRLEQDNHGLRNGEANRSEVQVKARSFVEQVELVKSPECGSLIVEVGDCANDIDGFGQEGCTP